MVTKTQYISQCLELAILFEISANKPGNVNRERNFKNTRYEHFLASAVALGPFFEFAAKKGVKIAQKDLSLNEIGLGQIIRDSVISMNSWQKGGNTLLGSVIMLLPVAVSAGIVITNDYKVNIPKLQESINLIVTSTTSQDAIHVYQAIQEAKPSGLGQIPKFDVNDPKSTKTIIKENLSLFQIFQMSSTYDTLCYEWCNKYTITFEVAYPILMKKLQESSLNDAIVETFLKVLSKYPDTLIVRKTTAKKASEISKKAKEILDLGSFSTLAGRKKFKQFNEELNNSGNLLNPGTTADLISVALAVCTLQGYRP